METYLVNIAIIGCGYWGQNLVRSFDQIKGCRIKAICDRAPERRSSIEERYGGIPTVEDYRAVLAAPEVGAVVIALPAADHYRATLEALESGKHVFVEKPLALRPEQGAELVEVAASKGLILFVGHTYLYNECVQRVKTYIDSGDLGGIYYIYSQRLNLGLVRRDVNVMWNLAPHDVSIVLYWLGEMPERASARGISFLQEGVEDVVFVHLEFSGGRTVHIHTSWLDPNKVRRMTLVGSKKMVVYDDVSADAKIQIYDKGISRPTIDASLGEYSEFGQFQLIHRAGDLVIPQVAISEPLRNECLHFIDCVTTGSKPVTSGEEGLQVVRVLAAAERSLREGGVSIPVV